MSIQVQGSTHLLDVCPVLSPSQKYESALSFVPPPCPSAYCRPHIEKEGISNRFLTKLPKSTIMTYLKKLVRIKSLSSTESSFWQDQKSVVVFVFGSLKQVLIYMPTSTPSFSHCY